MLRASLSVMVALTFLMASPAVARDQKVKLDGYAEYWSGDYLIVEGQRVVATSSTRLEGKGRAARFRGIPLGYEVKVEGVRRSDGAVVARKVEAKPNRSAMFERELEQAFDQSEASYRRRGRMASADRNGRIVQDHGELLESGPHVRRVRGIARRLLPPYVKDEDFRVYVVDNDEWNAMAAPNGSIYVFRGLLEDMDDDEVAIVVGHEIAHATHEHSRRQYKRSLWAGLAAAGASSAAGEVIGNRGARTAVQLGSVLGASAWQNGYGRKHEDQADRVGMRYAHEGGYDVSKAPRLWQRFADKYGSQNKAANFFFGSHSVATDRKRNAHQEIEHNYPN